ncbi:MAG TPA: DUF1203 domain-containing protein [Caulobacteraceae bacterium]|nr:DUF1203 domain-containing protein [Caulobacteraceae bacterium]
MTFRITGLPRTDFEHLFGLDDAALSERGIVRMTADATPGFPCRVGLRDLEPGETVLLLNHEHQGADTPFRSSHAIFVGEDSSPPALAPGELPEVLRRRTLSIRAFGADGMMIDADLAEGAEAPALIERLLADRRADYLHLHYARRGCWAARADRA